MFFSYVQLRLLLLVPVTANVLQLFILETTNSFSLSIDNHYNMDLAPKKEAIKVMIQDELTKLSEEADEDEDDDGGQDVGKKQKQHKTKEVEA
jgi:protein DEK